jgi:hypothetical protein
LEKYYRIAPAGKLAYPEKKWEADYRRRYPCLHNPMPNSASDIVLGDRPEEAALSMVGVANVYYARLDLLAALGSAVDQYMVLGSVFDSSGERLDEYRTLGTQDRLRMRGGPSSTRQFCSKCGQFLYYPMGKWYLLESDLTGKPLYFWNDSTCLVLNDSLFSRVDWKRWGKLYIQELPVFEGPQDGLPADLSKVAAKDV